MPVTSKEVETRTLLIEDGNGRWFKITIPVTCKVTYGPVAPGSQHNVEKALRIYDTKDKQRACFVGIKGFRDLSLPLERLMDDEWVVDKGDPLPPPTDSIIEGLARGGKKEPPREGEERLPDSDIRLHRPGYTITQTKGA